MSLKLCVKQLVSYRNKCPIVNIKNQACSSLDGDFKTTKKYDMRQWKLRPTGKMFTHENFFF